MLTYNPAFDLHHGIFRILQLLTASPGTEFEVGKLRLLDFLLLFPEQMESVRFPTESAQKRSLFTREKNPYRMIENPYRLFVELAPLHHEALGALAAHDLIDVAKLKQELVVRTTKPLPTGLAQVLMLRNAETSHLIDVVSKDLGRLPMFGDNGLKSRTKFLTSRHEIV